MENREKRSSLKRGDRDELNLLRRVFEDLGIAHKLIPNRDRGDAKLNPNIARYTPNQNSYIKPKTNTEKNNIITYMGTKKLNENLVPEVKPNKLVKVGDHASSKTESNAETGNPKEKSNLDKRRTIEITVSEVKNRKCDDIKDNIGVKELHTSKDPQKDNKKLEESKGKILHVTIKEDSRMKSVNKDQVLKTKPEGEPIKEKFRKTDETSRKIKENVKNAVGKLKEKTHHPRLPSMQDSQAKAIFEAKKLLKQKYTVKLNSNKNVEPSLEKENKDEDEAMKRTEEEVRKEIQEEDLTQDILQELIATAKVKKANEQTQEQRKPIIKTITLKNDNRVYKSVSFGDSKRGKKPTPMQMQIKIPNVRKSVESNTLNQRLIEVASNVSVHEKKEKHRKKNSFREKKTHRGIGKPRLSSPVLATRVACPPTEVAKWAPSSVTKHTKPYYEAWVDTTLAAIARRSAKDNSLLNHTNILGTFKRAFEMESRSESPDLIYEKINDEKIMGKITVRTKQLN